MDDTNDAVEFLELSQSWVTHIIHPDFFTTLAFRAQLLANAPLFCYGCSSSRFNNADSTHSYHYNRLNSHTQASLADEDNLDNSFMDVYICIV
ncbi:MAG: hypothetical protein H7Z11_24505 [Verrucomicrobia bacterium]|nr:hypothetical protein [Leptolyngbya sp. ES-bin-22]